MTGPPPPARRRPHLGGLSEAFADRNFRIFSLGSLASWAGYFIQLIAVSWLAWEMTESTLWLAWIALCGLGPNIVLSPFAGVLADRFDRVKIITACYVLLAAQAGALAALVWADALNITLLAVLTLAHGALIAVSVPCMMSILPRFVAPEKLASAIAVNSIYTQTALFAGPALAGWILAVYGAGPAFAVNALGYAAYLCVLRAMRTPKEYAQPKPAPRSVPGDLADGAVYIARHPGLLAVCVMDFCIDALWGAVTYMLPAYSDKVLGMGVEGVSIMWAAFGFGAAASALWLAWSGARAVRFDYALGGFIIAACALALMFTGHFWIALAAAAAAGAAGNMYETAGLSLMQTTVDDARRGRVMANAFTVSQSAEAIGVYAIGALAAYTGLAAPVLGLAGVCVAAGVFMRARRGAIGASFTRAAGGSI